MLADALGAGKTVTVIALVAADAPAARALPLTADEPRLSRASLIVVPPLIIRQWEAEIERFSGGQLRTVRVESAAQLQELSCKQLREAANNKAIGGMRNPAMAVVRLPGWPPGAGDAGAPS